MSRRPPRRRPARSARPPRSAPIACPCGRSERYDDCCGPLHRGESRATTVEQLMRSRFSAFAVHDEAYLLRSWHPTTRPSRIDFDRVMRWQRLDIVGTTAGSPFHTEGTVEFRAHYTEGGRAGELHENSRFVREDGEWLYVDGVISG